MKVCALDNPTGLSISYCDSLYFSTFLWRERIPSPPTWTELCTSPEDSTYAVVVTPSREIEHGFTTEDTVDAGGADGWSIEAGTFIEDAEFCRRLEFLGRCASRHRAGGPRAVDGERRDAQASEGEDVTFTVTLSEPAGGYESVGWKWSIESDDTAVGADILFDSGGVRFAKGSTTRRHVRSVPTAEENGPRGRRDLHGDAHRRNWRETGANPTAKGTILNDDVADTTTPLLTRVRTSADGRTIFLESDEAVRWPGLAPGPGFSPHPLADAYSLSIDGVTVQTWHPEYGGTPTSFSIRLLLEQVLSGPDPVLSYDKSKAGALAIADASGNEVASFTTGSGEAPALVNISTVTPWDHGDDDRCAALGGAFGPATPWH